jgi:hypothetical protein
VALPPSAYSSDQQTLRFFDDVIARTRALPGVGSVALTSRLPLRGEASVNVLSYTNDLRPMAARPIANYRYVSPGYFSTIGTPMLRGRTFRETDRGRQVVVLSASAADALWPGEDPIGRQLKTGGYLGAVSEVIGVVKQRASDLTRANVLLTYLHTGCGLVDRVARVAHGGAAGRARRHGAPRDLGCRSQRRNPARRRWTTSWRRRY